MVGTTIDALELPCPSGQALASCFPARDFRPGQSERAPDPTEREERKEKLTSGRIALDVKVRAVPCAPVVPAKGL